METARLVLWLVFGIGIVTMLVLDLGVFHRKSHTVGFKEALGWTAFWIGSALAFAAAVFVFLGSDLGSEFLTAYLIEESLSVDNLFVFAVIFAYFNVPSQLQHRVLFWGIIGALVMRGIMIVVGVAVLDAIHWMVFVFGGFLVFTSYKLATSKETSVHPDRNIAVRLFKRIFPTIEGYEGNKFFVRRNGKLYATVLFIVLIVVETTDLIFALDSIPAVLAISSDPLIVYTSNGFAILGLRSIFFVLVGLLGYFHYLKVGLSAVLLFVGTKMILGGVHIEIPIFISLAAVASILAVAVIASIIKQKTSLRQRFSQESEEVTEP